MHNITLTRTHTASNGSLHVELTINGKEVGLLYLTQDEANVLIAALKRGANDSDTRVNCDLSEDEYYDYSQDLYEDEGL